MDKSETLQLFRSLLEVSCLEVLEKLDARVSLSDECHLDTRSLPLARIDAGNSDFDASLAIAMPLSLLADTYPTGEPSENLCEADLQDWVCELANRTMGRVKNKLGAYSCAVKSGLPEFRHGEDRTRDTSELTQELKYCFDMLDRTCLVTLSIELFSDCIQFIENADHASVVEDGDIDYL